MTKRVLVIGFARSGAAVAQLLLHEGAQVVVSDPKLDLNDERVRQLQVAGVEFTTEQTPAMLDGIDMIVKNPGIPYRIPVLQAALERELPIYTEVALAQRYIKGEWIAVTGSNGKTTTTEMIATVLRKQASAAARVVVAGNIGTPVSEVAEDLQSSDTLLTELSSFQLMGMPTAHPNIAVITNIFASHLDYHGSRAAYIEAKMGITRNQTSADYLVINYDRDEWVDLAATSAAQTVPVSRLGKSKAGAYQDGAGLYFKDELVMQVTDLAVPGDHNIENALFAIAVGRLRGITAAEIKAALETFTGVEHRLQHVGEFLGRTVYNDSKATDIEATEQALSGFKQPVVLLAGGLERGDDQMRLQAAMRSNVKTLIVFGQTADKLAAVGAELNIPVLKTEDVVTAVPLAFAQSLEGDVILLSPAAASWDQYPNFETRGTMFMDAVADFVKQSKED